MAKEYACAIRPDQLIASSDVARSLSKQIERVNKGEELFILRNSAVMAVLLSLDEFNKLCHLADIAERLEIAEMLEARKDVDRTKDVDLEKFLSKRGL